MRSVTTPDGRTIAVYEGGDPAGIPVLVHNGSPNSGLLYERHLRDAEEKGIRLFSYDRPGYGGSTRNEGRSVADCAEDVVAICDALGVERFTVWGFSGGGPHALATAAALPDRVSGAAALGSLAPFDADGLDFYEGMGEDNVEGFKTSLESKEAHLAENESAREEFLAATPEQLVDRWASLLSPIDGEVLSGPFAAYFVESAQAGLAPSGDGWFDDDVAFMTTWGFDLASIRVPVLLWHGEQDKFVPLGHGAWLSTHIPGAESRLTPEDGHLTLVEHRMPEVHAWLLERFSV
jgi:pimeloyl-ACP methyl ester carboxylesterase